MIHAFVVIYRNQLYISYFSATLRETLIKVMILVSNKVNLILITDFSIKLYCTEIEIARKIGALQRLLMN